MIFCVAFKYWFMPTKLETSWNSVYARFIKKNKAAFWWKIERRKMRKKGHGKKLRKEKNQGDEIKRKQQVI